MINGPVPVFFLPKLDKELARLLSTTVNDSILVSAYNKDASKVTSFESNSSS